MSFEQSTLYYIILSLVTDYERVLERYVNNVERSSVHNSIDHWPNGAENTSKRSKQRR